MDRQLITAKSKSNSSANKKKEQGLGTRQDIMTAAEYVFFDKGVAATTLELIAEKANVTRGAIYWHFKNKNQLLEQVIDGAIIPLLDSFREALIGTSSPGIDQLRKASIEIISDIIHSPSHQRRLAIALLKCEYTSEFAHLTERHVNYHEEIREVLITYLTKIAASQDMLFRSPSLIAESILFYYTGLLTQFLKHPDKINLQQDLSDYIDIFINSILSKQAEKTP